MSASLKDIGLSDHALAFLFGVSNHWESKNKAFHDLLESLSNDPKNDDLHGINTLPTLYARAVALRRWRFGMMAQGRTVEQIQIMESDWEWVESGRPPLVMATRDNPYSLPEFALRGEWRRMQPFLIWEFTPKNLMTL